MEKSEESKSDRATKQPEANVENPANILKNLSFGGEITIHARYLDAYLALKSLKDVIAMHVLFLTRCVRRSMMLRGSKRNFKVGIIGCGQIGSHCVNKLLEAGVSPSQVGVSTRRPEEGYAKQLSKKWDDALIIENNNGALARSSRLLFICCTPSQLSQVASSIRNKVKASTVVVTCVIGYTDRKVQNMIGCPNNVLQLSITGNAKRVGSMFVSCQTMKQKALVAAENLGGSVEKIDSIIECVTRLCHDVRPIVRDHDLETMDDMELKEKLLKNAEMQSMELSRQSGALAVLGTNQQFQGIPMEYEKLKMKFIESYIESVI